MTNDFDLVNRWMITFSAGATSDRTIEGSTENTFYDNGGSKPKIENNSSGSHTINFPIKVGYNPMELNPINGNLTFGGAIDNNGNFIDVYGENSKHLNVEAGLSGTGGFSIKENSKVVFMTTACTYSGATTIEAGELELQTNLASSEITVKNGAKLLINASEVITNDVTVESGGTLEVSAGMSLTVNGNLSNSGTITLLSDGTGKPAGNATGSLIVNGTITGNINIQRNIDGYSSSSDGWHLISTPMPTTTVATSDFNPGANDDLYWYDEANDIWRNYKTSSFDMVKGKGYLCAYETGEVKVFTGNPNNSDVSVTGLTVDGSGTVTEAGWNLVGNPFASAITWSNTWGSDIVATAKIYSDADGNYIDVTAGSAIPSMQGFFIQVISSTSMTIPTSAQAHSTNNWLKQKEMETLKIKVSGGTNSFSDVTRIKFNEEATSSFDVDFDSHKLFGQSTAPQLYSNINGELFSTNTFPTSEEPEDVEMNFKPGTSGEYTLEVLDNSISNMNSIYLEDRLTGQIVDLSANPSYAFSAEVGNEENRFKLHFGATGVEEVQKESLQAYFSGGQLYILGEEGKAELKMFNLQGQELFSEIVMLNIQYNRTLSLQAGIYLVSLQTEKSIKTAKIIIK